MSFEREADRATRDERRQPDGFANYVWQLRPYSYVDLLLLLFALRATATELVGVSLLWFGFLMHLEWRHRDVGRRRWPAWTWIGVWASALLFIRRVTIIGVFVAAAGYSLKKRWKPLGAISCVVNGCVKGALVALIAAAHWQDVLLVSGIMAVRNLAGDVRDAGKDASEGITSLPVLLGYRRNTRIIYPACLVATSCLWTFMGRLPWWAMVGAIAVEAMTYGRTPR
jgi:4-hydroxybenzoate polyprenyltransferase